MFWGLVISGVFWDEGAKCLVGDNNRIFGFFEGKGGPGGGGGGEGAADTRKHPIVLNVNMCRSFDQYAYSLFISKLKSLLTKKIKSFNL